MGVPVWPSDKAQRSRDALIRLQMICESVFKEDPGSDVSNELGKFLTVRSCGYLEITTAECILGFVRRHAVGPVGDFSASLYKTWTSPKYVNLKNTLELLSPELAYAFKDYLNSERDYANDLGSLVSSRDKIAHGQNEQVTVRKAIQYCKSALYVSDWYLECFAPDGLADSIQKKHHDCSI